MFFQLIQSKVAFYVEKKKHEIIFHALENMFHLISHLYKRLIDERHHVGSQYLSLLACLCTCLVIELRLFDKHFQNVIRKYGIDEKNHALKISPRI